MSGGMNVTGSARALPTWSSSQSVSGRVARHTAATRSAVAASCSASSGSHPRWA